MDKFQEIPVSDVRVGSFLEPVGFENSGFARRVKFVKSEFIEYIVACEFELLGLFGGLIRVLCWATGQVQGALTHDF